MQHVNKLLNLYFTGSTNFTAPNQAPLKPSELYTQEELEEYEIDVDKQLHNYKNPILNQATDFESLGSSLQASSVAHWDSIFSSIGAALSQRTPFIAKAFISLTALASSLIASKVKIPLLSSELSFFRLGGRLIRSPLHFFDSYFSVLGEDLSSSSIARASAFTCSGLALIKNLTAKHRANFNLDFETINGTLAKSAIHHIHSLLSSSAIRFFTSNPLLASSLAIGSSTGILSLPKTFRSQQISWNLFDGVLGQGLIHFIDSIYSSLGNRIYNAVAKNHSFVSSLALVLACRNLHKIPNLEKLIKEKIPFPQLDGKLIRAAIHLPETIFFKLGDKLSESTQGKLLLAILGLEGLLKPNFKIDLNTLQGISTRLPLDLLHSASTKIASQLSTKIPAPLLLLLGPAASHLLSTQLGSISTKYTESQGLIMKQLVAFWETLLSCSANGLVKNLIPSKNSQYTGSMLADGRWLDGRGRILPSMMIGKSLA